VARIGRPIEVGHVAGRTRLAGQVVRAGGTEGGVVALSALHRDMESGQRKSGRRVVKGRIEPVGRAMALLTGLREVGLHVARIRRSLEVLQVAGDAGVAGQVVGTRRTEGGVVALRALQRGVESGERKSGGGVVERAVAPVVGRVALLAAL